uniref:Uncharacterized protein n=1 Tax=Panstrongylus lignarius TaxID=156445 RepID=A0A224XT90_9HEMI
MSSPPTALTTSLGLIFLTANLYGTPHISFLISSSTKFTQLFSFFSLSNFLYIPFTLLYSLSKHTFLSPSASRFNRLLKAKTSFFFFSNSSSHHLFPLPPPHFLGTDPFVASIIAPLNSLSSTNT